MTLQTALRNGVSTILGAKPVLPIATALAKIGLRGLGVNVSFEPRYSGEAWLLNRALPVLSSPVCLDIGANVGDFTQKARACGAAYVFAFEPVPDTFQRLEAAVGSDEKVRLYQSAVGEREGTTTFFCPLTESDSSLASRDIGITSVDPTQATKIDVPMTTIDGLRKALGIHFDVIKIDVEGYELEVLKGATETIRTSPPALVQFEFNSHHGHRRQVMRDFMEALPGYRFFRLAASSLRPLDPSDYLSTIYAYQNIVCIHGASDRLLKTLM